MCFCVKSHKYSDLDCRTWTTPVATVTGARTRYAASAACRRQEQETIPEPNVHRQLPAERAVGVAAFAGMVVVLAIAPDDCR